MFVRHDPSRIALLWLAFAIYGVELLTGCGGITSSSRSHPGERGATGGAPTAGEDAPATSGSWYGSPGFVAVAGGAPAREVGPRARHRPRAAPCDRVRAASEPGLPFGGLEDASAGISCTADSECTRGVNGRCSRLGVRRWQCTYDECFSDDDCPGDGGTSAPAVCECERGGLSDNRVCLKFGNCRIDADCGPEGYCSPSLGSCGDFYGIQGYYCRSPSDECVDDTDCPSAPSSRGYCAFTPDAGHFKCSTDQCGQ